MRNIKARAIRKLVGFDPKQPNEIQKRLYRRFKKAYTRTPEPQKAQFLEALQVISNNK